MGFLFVLCVCVCVFNGVASCPDEDDEACLLGGLMGSVLIQYRLKNRDLMLTVIRNQSPSLFPGFMGLLYLNRLHAIRLVCCY